MIQCNFSKKLFKSELRQRVAPLLLDSTLTDLTKKLKIIESVADISKELKINTAEIKQALEITKALFGDLHTDSTPSDTDIMAALSSWKYKAPEVEEDNSDDKLSSIPESKFNDDIWESAYSTAMNAKIRAKLQATKVGIASLLYNENGIIQTTTDLNLSIQNQQELLLKNVVKYLKQRVQDSKLDTPMYDQNGYTGIVEYIKNTYDKYLNKENFNVSNLNLNFNDRNFTRLDAYSSWILLNNFGTILTELYGKSISINPDLPKFTKDLTKYSIVSTSNMIKTFRTNDEIDVSKEVSNIVQQIITSIPFVHHNTTTPTEQNVKFSEFVYIIGKLKDLPITAKSDYIFENVDSDLSLTRSGLSLRTRKFIEGKSMLDMITLIRDNPQEYLPIIFELLTNNTVRGRLNSNNVIDTNTFLDIDLDIMTSLNNGLFNGENSLEAIQSKSGYDGVNYFAFITLTIDSIYKASFLLYFRDSEGTIYMRNMFDLSISTIEWNIKDTINSINSLFYNATYDASKYNLSETKRELAKDQKYNVKYNNEGYQIRVSKDGNITIVNLSKNNELVTNAKIQEEIIKEYQDLHGIPSEVEYTIDNFKDGKSLRVTVNMDDGKIRYYHDGNEILSFTKEDYDNVLAEIILDTLKLNFHIDPEYFLAFHKGNIPFAIKLLMDLTSRVITNLYISNKYLKNNSPGNIKSKIKQIYKHEDTRPYYNTVLGEMNVTSNAEIKIISNLAQAKAVVTGRLTSSQILDGDGNALSATSLSRLMGSTPYQILKQNKAENSPSKDFALWKRGAYLGIQQLKEIKDRGNDTSKSLTQFTPAEFEQGALMIDFLHALVEDLSRTSSPINKGIAGFLPSENSDKTYIGRMLVDLKKIDINGQSLYDLLKTGRNIQPELLPVVFKELGAYYNGVLENINQDWERVRQAINTWIITTGKNIPLIPVYGIKYGQWGYINSIALQLNSNPVKILNDVTTWYNNLHPTNPITLTDLVHYINKKGNLTINASLLANVERFNDIEKLGNFIKLNENDLLRTLLKDKLDLDDNPDFKKLFLSEEEHSRWVDPYTNKIILAYLVIGYDIDGSPELKPIRKMRDIEGDFNNPDFIKSAEFILNPLIANYNLCNYFLTLEFMNSTVGAYYAHPSKDKTGTELGDEKSRKSALDKRNVSHTASMHSILKGLLQGVPDKINIAMMPDVIDAFQTISGLIYDEIAPFDGATFGNPFFTKLENNSLGGNRVGVNKKTFTHFYDHCTGTGGIIKTAEFPLTNNNIRGSKFLQVMMLNMTDRKWFNQDGSDAIVDITKRYNGKPMMLTNPTDLEGNLYFQDENTGKYYQITSIQSLGNNQYIRTLYEIDNKGRRIGEEFPDQNPILVNTNYKLWKLFGGDRAMEFKVGDDVLTESEHSIDVVVNIMNNTGTIKEGTNIVKYQSDIWQPLKHADIHLMPTVGAVKQGAGNINSIEAYSVADSSKINFMLIALNHHGVQLDKEHHADGEDLSIMTLVLSACASRGFTLKETQQMYNALAALARAGMRDYITAFDEFFQNPTQETKNKYQEVILDTLIDAFAHNRDTELMLTMVTRELLEKAKLGKEISFNEKNSIAFSDPAVFRRLHSTVSVALTKAAIKIKIPGILSVLQPSYNVVKLYNGKTLRSFLNDAAIIAEQETLNADPNYELLNRLDQIRIGRTYKIVHPDGSINYATIKTHSLYYKLKELLRSHPESITSIREQFAPVEGIFEGGRELAAYNATFAGRTVTLLSNTQLMEDTAVLRLQIDSVRGWELKLLKAQQLGLQINLDTNPRDIYEFVSLNFPILSRQSVSKETSFKSADLTKFSSILRTKENGGISIEKAAEQIYGQLPDYLAELTNSLEIRNIILDILTSAISVSDINRAIYKNRIEEALLAYDNEYQQYLDYASTLEDKLKHYNIYDLASVKEVARLQDAKASKAELVPAMQRMLEDFMKLHKRKGQLILEDGNTIELDASSVNIEPYEVVMPKIFKEIFGLDTYDDLQTIKNDPEFFTKRLLERVKVEISPKEYSVGLMRLSGKHTYLLDSNLAVQRAGEFERIDIQKAKINGLLWRVDENGNKKHRLFKDTDEVWVKNVNGKNVEVIVTDNIYKYINDLKFTTLSISPNSDYNTIIKKLQNSKKRSIRNYIEALNRESEISGTYNDAVYNLSFNDLENHPLEGFVKELGAQLHNSFLKSLEIVAARIPAQSMQSFMPMKVVAFDAPDINTAYVNTAQFLFQGSKIQGLDP